MALMKHRVSVDFQTLYDLLMSASRASGYLQASERIHEQDESDTLFKLVQAVINDNQHIYTGE